MLLELFYGLGLTGSVGLCGQLDLPAWGQGTSGLGWL